MYFNLKTLYTFNINIHTINFITRNVTKLSYFNSWKSKQQLNLKCLCHCKLNTAQRPFYMQQIPIKYPQSIVLNITKTPCDLPLALPTPSLAYCDRLTNGQLWVEKAEAEHGRGSICSVHSQGRKWWID